MLTPSGRVPILVNLQVNMHNLKRKGKEGKRVERRD